MTFVMMLFSIVIAALFGILSQQQVQAVQLDRAHGAIEQVTNLGTKAKINVDVSESSSDSSDSDEPSDAEHVAVHDDLDLPNVSPNPASTQFDCSNCHVAEFIEQPKPQTFKADEGKVDTIFNDYNGADNDDFIHQMIEDFGVHSCVTEGNPGGIILNKFNGERATRRFIETALKLSSKRADAWMEKNFEAAWDKYDVNKTGQIDENMAPTYFRSLLGDFTAQFSLDDNERFKQSLRNAK